MYYWVKSSRCSYQAYFLPHRIKNLTLVPTSDVCPAHCVLCVVNGEILIDVCAICARLAIPTAGHCDRTRHFGGGCTYLCNEGRRYREGNGCQKYPRCRPMLRNTEFHNLDQSPTFHNSLNLRPSTSIFLSMFTVLLPLQLQLFVPFTQREIQDRASTDRSHESQDCACTGPFLGPLAKTALSRKAVLFNGQILAEAEPGLIWTDQT